MKNEKTTTFKNRILNDFNDQMSKEMKRSKQIKPSEKLILSSIMSWERQDKDCWMSNKSLADENGLGLSTVERTISNLKKIKVLDIIYKQQFGKEIHVLSINYNGLEALLKKEEKETIQPEEKILEEDLRLVEEQSITLQPEEQSITLQAEEQSITLQAEEQTEDELSKEELTEMLNKFETNKNFIDFIQQYIEDKIITTQTKLKEYLYAINNPESKSYKYEQQKH